jgi:hypothetical protein
VRATHKIYTPWKRETEGGKDCIYVGERVGEKPHERERGSVREKGHLHRKEEVRSVRKMETCIYTE